MGASPHEICENGGMEIMSKTEYYRYRILDGLVRGLYTSSEAAKRLGLSQRRIFTLKKEFNEQGQAAVFHGNKGRKSPKKTSELVVQQIMLLRKLEGYKDMNFTHFHECVQNELGIQISLSTVRRILKDHGQSSPRRHKRRRKKVFKARERKPAQGMLLQGDATPYQWLGDDHYYALHGFIDDATGIVTGLYFTKNECLLGYLEVLRQTLTHYGAPQALYTDRASVFFVNPKKTQELSIEEQLEGVEKNLTQFGKIVEQLGIQSIAAKTPQAKGRIERLWNTLQGRLPQILALHGIHDIDAANRFLPSFIQDFNEKFAVPAKSTENAFQKVPAHIDLDRLLSVCFERTLSRGSSISLHRRKFVIEQDRYTRPVKVQVLLSEKHGLRALINGCFYPIYPLGADREAWKNPQHGHFPEVLIELIQKFLLEDTKAA